MRGVINFVKRSCTNDLRILSGHCVLHKMTYGYLREISAAVDQRNPRFVIVKALPVEFKKREQEGTDVEVKHPIQPAVLI